MNGNKIAYTQNHTLTMGMETRDATTKDSSGWATKKEGLRSWSISGDGLYYFAATYGPSDLFGLLENRTRVSLKFTTNVSGDKYFTGYAYLTSLEVSAPQEDTASFSFSFEGDGAIDEVTLT